MGPLSRRFIKASLIYLGVGALLGLALAILPDFGFRLRPVHVHVMLVGWVSMLMFGVGYHILPRFNGRVLPSDSLGDVHLWAANVGLVGMAISMYAGSLAGTAVFGGIQAIGFFLFIFNIWRSIAPFVPPSGSAGTPAGPQS